MTNTITAFPLIERLRRISPSRYAGFSQCALREIWSGMRLPVMLPSSPKSMLGTAIHKLLEEAGKGDIADDASLDAHWEQIIAKIEQETSQVSSHLFPLKRSIADYEIRRIRAFDKAKEIIDARQQHTSGVPTASEFEVWLSSTDRQVGGYVDELKTSDTGKTIRDFKTGPILDQSIEGSPVKEAYAMQLKLYAALLAEQTGEYPIELELVPLQGSPVEVPFTALDCDQLLEEARELLKRINDLVDANDYSNLCSPSPNACNFCAYRPVCPTYLAEIEKQDSQYGDKLGTVQSITQLRNGNQMVSVESAEGVVHLRGIGLNGNHHPVLIDLKPGDQVGLFNILRAADGSYFETKLTTIYRYKMQ